MEISLITTEDGSHSLHNSEFNENYHSVHGAVTESMHVFIHAGLKQIGTASPEILEAGLGTGLNALLTWKYAREKQIRVIYTGIELYPPVPVLTDLLNYPEILDVPREIFKKMHENEWETFIPVSEFFLMRKLSIPLEEYEPDRKFDLVYFDAFSPAVQPGLWTTDIFSRIYKALNPGGILVTYSCMGLARRNLKAAGFSTEKIPGPPGKREMTRAWKK